MMNKQIYLDSLSEVAKQQGIALVIGSSLSYPPYVSWSNFPEEAIKLAQKSGAQKYDISSYWAINNKRKIWGISVNLRLVLTNSIIYPFFEIKKEINK